MANKLSLNTVKTDFMIIGTSKRLENLDTSPETTPYALYINNAPIRRVKQAKNLGLIIDEHLSWEQHIEYISGKLRRNIGILKRMSTVLPNESLDMIYLLSPISDIAVLFRETVEKHSKISYKTYKIERLE